MPKSKNDKGVDMKKIYPKKRLTNLLLNVVVLLAGFIVHKKKQLAKTVAISKSILLLFIILVYEIVLAIFALPIYIFFNTTKCPQLFNEEGFSYSLYRMRKRATASILIPLLLILGLNIYFSRDTEASNPPVVDFATSQVFSQSDWSGGTGPSTSTQYTSGTDMVTSTAGQLSLVPWYNTSWSSRKKITIQASQVSGSADLTNFPMLITEDNIGSDFFSTVKGDGTDIVFTSSDGTTELAREVVSINTAGETIESWVNIPTLSATTNTEIYLYYGNAGASETNSSTTWNSNFEMVQHMNEGLPVATQIDDSTSNVNHGSISCSSSDPTFTTGQMGNAIDFDGNDCIVLTSSESNFDFSTSFSLSMWVQRNNTATSSYRMLNKPGDGAYWQNAFDLGIAGSTGIAEGYFYSTVGGFRSAESAAGVMSNTNWHRITNVWDSTSGTIYTYVDGVESGSSATLGEVPQTSNQSVVIGAGDTSGTEAFDGVIDEIRVLTTALSADWIATEYSNQNAPASFYAVGSVQALASHAATITSSIFAVGNTSSSWGTYRYTSDEQSLTSIKIRTGNSSDLSDATGFGGCSAIAINADISSNSCVTDGHQYMQYQVTLSMSSTGTIPVFQDITVQSLNTSTVSIAENGGSVTLTATLDETSSSTVTVPYTVSGTATTTDHDLTAGNITITAGSLTGTTSIGITDDTINEPDETIIVTMGTPTNAVTGTLTTQTITITDNSDATPTVSLSLGQNNMLEAGDSATVIATLSAVSGYTVSTTLSFSGTATNGTDYTAGSSGIIAIPAGSTTSSITLTAIEDNLFEGDETIVMTVNSITNATESGTQEITLTLNDNDGGAVVPIIAAPQPTTGSPPPTNNNQTGEQAEPVETNTPQEESSDQPEDITTPDDNASEESPQEQTQETQEEAHATAKSDSLPTQSGKHELVKLPNDPKVYLVQNGVRRWIENEETFVKNNFDWSRIKEIAAEQLATYEEGATISDQIEATEEAQPAPSEKTERAAPFTQHLRFGDQGDIVVKLQRFLKFLGHFPQEIDATGYFGQITTNAVRKLQQEHNLSPVGVVGPKTRRILNILYTEE